MRLMNQTLENKMMLRQYVGFDVGGWLTRSSHDAIARLVVDGKARTWDLLSRDLKGRRVRNALHPENVCAFMDRLFETVVPIPTIIAIDAALGWPTEFQELIKGAVPKSLPSTESKSIENKVLYRETERYIYHTTNTNPLTAVGDMFGNPSTKAQATALRIRKEYSGYMPPFDQWSREQFCRSLLTIVEVYPASIGVGGTFPKKVKAEIATINKELRGLGQKVLTKDEADAVCCALIAEDLHHAVCGGSDDPDRVYDLPDGDSSGVWDTVVAPTRENTPVNTIPIDFERVRGEGWIFTFRSLR